MQFYYLKLSDNLNVKIMRIFVFYPNVKKYGVRKLHGKGEEAQII